MARYTLIIGTRNWSSWSLRPFMALRATGAAFETVVIRLRQTEHPTTREQILKHSRAGKVPVLKIIEGGKTLTVWDSLAICETLAERHPEAGLWPADADARAIARSYACEMHSGFPDVRDQLAMDFARTLPMPELRDDTKAADRPHHRSLGASAGDIQGRVPVRPLLASPTACMRRWCRASTPMAWRCRPSCAAYMDRMMALPAMQDWKAAQAEVEEACDQAGSGPASQR